MKILVLECVNRLLEKGYKPECLELEHTWPSGRNNSGRLDIMVKKDDKPYLMIECKTWDKEYKKEKENMKRTKKVGGEEQPKGQLFSYCFEEKTTQYLCLYASIFDGKMIRYENAIIPVEEEWKTLSNQKEVFDYWNKSFKKNGIFDKDITPYNIECKAKLIVDSTPEYHAADRRSIIEANKKNTLRHAYYHEYRDLQRLCILILQNQKHQFGFGNRKVYGILFDGAWLWEEYVNTLIGDIFYHPMNKAGAGAQRLFAGGIGLIYPDFIGRDTENRIIADAKYKPIDNIGNKDYLQVLAYMFRFDAKKGYYLYPDAKESGDFLLMLNSGSTYEKNVLAREDISITKHGLKIPSDYANYKDFVEQIKISESTFISSL